MTTLNIEFADGNKFEYYDDDTYKYGGCPTCDYGSEYINELSIRTTNYCINIELNQMYEYAFSTADAIQMFAINLGVMSERDFINYIKAEFEKYDEVLKKLDIKERK